MKIYREESYFDRSRINMNDTMVSRTANADTRLTLIDSLVEKSCIYE